MSPARQSLQAAHISHLCCEVEPGERKKSPTTPQGEKGIPVLGTSSDALWTQPSQPVNSVLPLTFTVHQQNIENISRPVLAMRSRASMKLLGHLLVDAQAPHMRRHR